MLLRPSLRRLAPQAVSAKNAALSTPRLGRSMHTEGFWKWTTQSRPFWMKDWKEGIIACIVFGITGTSSMMLVRPAVGKLFHWDEAEKDGPNYYRIAVSCLFVTPIYTILLATFGTLAGRHTFFAGMAFKILRRFIPARVGKNLICAPARNKLFPPPPKS